MQADHHLPLIEIGKHYTDYTVAELADRIWCEEGNLKPMCKVCHKAKSKEENKLRRKKK